MTHNRTCERNGSLFHLLTFIVLIAAYSTAARADDESKYQRILEGWSQKIPDLEKNDTGETAKDIALIRSWIGQAQAFVASEDFEKIDPILERLETITVYIRVRQQRAKVDAAIKAAAAKLEAINRSINQTKAEADEMLGQIKKTEGKK